MPTISELPNTSTVTAADQIPISQGGSACSVIVGTLLANTQPAILIETGNLFGRTSLGPGGPDPVAVGLGLALNSGSLAATGADHADFPVATTLNAGDDAVLSSSGTAKLLPLSSLRGLFSAGENISIDPDGTITATATGGTLVAGSAVAIGSLPTVTAIGSNDLIGISQSGTDHAISYGNFLDGQTINQLQTAAAAADTDSLLVAQSGSILARQSLGALWPWVTGKLPSYQPPTLELTTNTTLSAAAHSGHVLVCSQPVSVTVTPTVLTNGFACSMLNLSSGNVTLAGSISTSSGSAVLLPGQAANLQCVTFSGGTVVYAWMSGGSTTTSVPAEVTNVVAAAVTVSSVSLTWSALLPAPTSYVVQYRVTGTTTWLVAPSVTTDACTVTGLLASTAYDFTVSATNSSGTGLPSAIVTTMTSAALSVPGAVTGVTAGTPTTSSLTVAWSAPTSGGAASSFTVQYRVTGTTPWSTGATGLTITSLVVSGLTSATSYDFEVFAVNAAGTGAASTIVTASTAAAGNSVTALTWNIVPSGSYTHGSGAIGVNAQVAPSTAPVQFGFSTSKTVTPTSWTAGTYVNTNLWGAYVNTPSTPGTYYAWVEGTDGSLPTVYPTSFSVT